MTTESGAVGRPRRENHTYQISALIDAALIDAVDALITAHNYEHGVAVTRRRELRPHTRQEIVALNSEARERFPDSVFRQRQYVTDQISARQRELQDALSQPSPARPSRLTRTAVIEAALREYLARQQEERSG